MRGPRTAFASVSTHWVGGNPWNKATWKGIMDRKLNVDTEISITLEPMEVIIMEGVTVK